MNDPSNALARLLSEHCYDTVDCNICGCGERFEDELVWAAHVLDLITAEFLVVPHSEIPQPLGYLVLSRNPDTGRLTPQGRVHAAREYAQDWRRHLETPGGPRIPLPVNRRLLIGEIREVPDDA